MGFDFFCGGSIIGKRSILTAAHCFITNGKVTGTKETVIVVVGIFGISGKNEKNTYKIEKIANHQDYNGTSFRDDITIITLDRDIKFNSIMKPVCLPKETEDDFAALSVKASGWGISDIRTKKTSHFLKYIELTTTNEECNNNEGDENYFICAKGKKAKGKSHHQDVCRGDSGGPLTFELKNGESPRTVQIGAVSHGERKLYLLNLHNIKILSMIHPLLFK